MPAVYPPPRAASQPTHRGDPTAAGSHCHGPPATPRPRAGDSPMALAGGGAAAAADAGLRLAARPPALPPSAAAAPSGPPPPPRAPPASQPGGDSQTPPTPIPPRGRGPSAHGAYALPRPDGLSGSAPAAASACSSSFSLAASAQLLTRSPPASPSTQRLPAQPLRPALSPRLSPAPPSPGSVTLLFPPAPENRGSARRPFWNRAHAAGARRPHGGLCPDQRCPPCLTRGARRSRRLRLAAGAMLGAAPLRARLARPGAGQAGTPAPPVAAHTGGVGKGRRESGTGMGRESEALRCA